MPRWKNSLMTEDVQRIKRDAVLKEAGRAFSKRGFHNTSLDDVAKALQVSKGTLYNYVQDKQEILFEFYRIGTEIGLRAFEMGEEAGGSGAQVLHTTLRTYIELLTEELGACGALMELDALRPEDRAVAVKSRDAFQRKFLNLIEAGIKDGSLRPIEDPKLAIYTFMGAINWMPRWYSQGGRLSSREIAEHMTDLLLAGMVNRPGAQSRASAAVEAKSRPRQRRTA
jgi:AcrR family transcriptional regulator